MYFVGKTNSPLTNQKDSPCQPNTGDKIIPGKTKDKNQGHMNNHKLHTPPVDPVAVRRKAVTL